ncbi:hypothetical protein [uncultured Variovorax sp.]|uniref:hypothetical protein n=1 Tax=uncultured Variovorax sp. TaxID=114708 RepID=UPI0026229F18|nr:hypothetical protein [uncultured Variovorax sp.]
MRRLFGIAAALALASAGASAQLLVNGQTQTVPAAVPNADYLSTAGARMSPQIPFYRIGEPYQIAFTPTSGSVEVPVTPPPGATSFRYSVNAPCSVRFRGRVAGAPFVPLTATTGWLWFPATQDIFTSLQPISVVAMGVDGPFASVQAAQKACSGVVELQFGTGQ